MKRIPDRYAPDDWTEEGAKILFEASLTKIRNALARGPVIVQHWFYRGASSPRVISFEDIEEFEAHFEQHAIPGDAFEVWSFNDVCKMENVLTEGKLHDTDGCVPRGGAY